MNNGASHLSLLTLWLLICCEYMKKKFEYFLNAIHYCLWLFDIKFGDFIGRVVDILLSPVPKYLFTKEYRKKYDERLSKVQTTKEKFFYDKKNGYHIGWVNHWFGYIYSGYPAFLSFILMGFYFRSCEEMNYLIVLITASIPIGICYVPAYRAVFSKDRYLKYFKQFEKEDAQWHKKWKRITILFCIGSVIVTFMGIIAMWGVLLA